MEESAQQSDASYKIAGTAAKYPPYLDTTGVTRMTSKAREYMNDNGIVTNTSDQPESGQGMKSYIPMTLLPTLIHGARSVIPRF